MSKRMIPSYDIRINPDYTDLIAAIEENRVKRMTTIIEGNKTDDSCSDGSMSPTPEKQTTPAKKSFKAASPAGGAGAASTKSLTGKKMSRKQINIK